VRIGSNTVLVAPVTVGDGAYTAAGSIITQDVAAGALGVARARQHTSEGWVARRWPGTAAANAAAAGASAPPASDGAVAGGPERGGSPEFGDGQGAQSAQTPEDTSTDGEGWSHR
jgi:bifunctional UDP-N-acetylglucosamine pyrophosphorylase/glucosamine-1-phosphate N-acetyltransferase